MSVAEKKIPSKYSLHSEDVLTPRRTERNALPSGHSSAAKGSAVSLFGVSRSARGDFCGVTGSAIGVACKSEASAAETTATATAMVSEKPQVKNGRRDVFPDVRGALNCGEDH
jgi:hypothetical protein